MFAIYELAAGGGTIALCPMPKGAADLAQIAAWQPGLVVTMTQAAEMPPGLVAGLAGLTHLQVPVADYGVPAPDVGWGDAEGQIMQALARGGRVLVHCLGGCGRSGMAVLRCMVAAGEDPHGALLRLRGVRPCAVETDVQLAWATAV